MILEAGLGEPGYDPMLEYQPDQGLVSNNCLFSEKKRNKQFLPYPRIHNENFFIINTAQGEVVSGWNCFLQNKQFHAEVRGNMIGGLRDILVVKVREYGKRAQYYQAT